MPWQYHPIILLFFVGGLIALGVAFFSAHHIEQHGLSYPVAAIGLFGFHNAIWAIAAGLKMASTELPLKLLFYKLEYLGSAVTPSLAVVVAVILVGWDHYLNRRITSVLAVVPLVVISLILFNPQQVMIADPTIIQARGIAVFEHRFPPLFVLFLAWGLGLVLLAVGIVGIGIRRRIVPWKPGMVALLVFLVPLITVGLKVSHIYPPGGTGINVTPAANAIVLGLLAISIVKYRVYDLLPIGRHQAVEVMGDGYILLDPDETVVDHNTMATEVLQGESGRDLRGEPAQSVFPEENIQSAFEEADQPQFTVGERTIQVLRSRIEQNNRVAGHVLLLRDITAKQDRIQELERANQRLDQFASIVSHDLRNPLNVAKGRVELARKTFDSEDLATASDALDRMQSIIADVLMLTRQGQAVTDMQWQRLSSIAEACWNNCETAAGTLVVDSDVRICCDPSRVKRLLENAFRNAIEHGGADSTVRVGALEHESGFYIADDGEGFPDAERDRLAEYEYSTVEESSGLGLAIVKEIAQAHEWHLRLTDSAAGGARIEISEVDTEAV